MTIDEYDRIVKTWIATAKHPKTGRLYPEMVYQPMLELLAYLRSNGFRTFIVSGGGIDFMRAFAEKVYDIATFIGGTVPLVLASLTVGNGNRIAGADGRQ
jgi:phosphoserine phosphatase